MSRRRYRKYVIRWIVTLILVTAIVTGVCVGCSRLLHIYMTSTGRKAPDVPDKDQYPVRGVDVSYYQGSIDWNVLASQNITFCFMKATEGIDHNDIRFAENWESAKNANIYVGAYHFYRFENSGEEQALNFISTVPVTENTLPPVIDVELYDSLEKKPDVQQVRENLQIMLDLLEEHYGVKPILYAAPNTYRTYIRYFADTYPVWISNYYYEPYHDWTFWQYTDSGQLQGYDGDQTYIDMNVYCDSYAAFLEEFQLQPFSS